MIWLFSYIVMIFLVYGYLRYSFERLRKKGKLAELRDWESTGGPALFYATLWPLLILGLIIWLPFMYINELVEKLLK